MSRHAQRLFWFVSVVEGDERVDYAVSAATERAASATVRRHHAGAIVKEVRAVKFSYAWELRRWKEQ